MARVATALLIFSLGVHGAAAEDRPPAQCAAVSRPPRATVRPSTANPQYVVYNGRTQALVGASASYLCHIDQPGTFGNPLFPLTPSMDYCAFNNYRDYLDYLRAAVMGPGQVAAPLNKMQLWIGLNHSPGIQRRGTAYDHETPFQKPYDTNGAPDEWFFSRLQCVLDEAWSRDVIVEVTIFDPWQGDYETSPWKAYFGPNQRCFASKDFVLPSGSTCRDDPDTGARNRAGWDKQKQLITELVTRFCSYPNLYYGVANELDLMGAPDKILSWQQEMAAHLTTTEARLGCGHFVAANLHISANVDSLPSVFKAINAHYAHTPDAERIAAIELLRTRHNAGSGGPELNRIFGFNETKITSLIPVRKNENGYHFQSADAARAEAWEFLLSEGGVYDLYIERWRCLEDCDTAAAVSSLQHVSGLLTETDLGRVQRSGSVGNALPAWISAGSSLEPYGTGNTRWGAMHSPMTLAGDANFLYIHHSTLEGAGFQRYGPQIRSDSDPYPAPAIYAILPAGNYRADWIDPRFGTIRKSAGFPVATAHQPALVPGAPAYTFDIALRVTRTDP